MTTQKTPSKRLTKYISPERYAKFSDDEQFYFFPEFKKYKTVKERDYCDQCGHFTGWISREVGVGKPYRYRQAHGSLEVSMAMMNQTMYKQVMNSNDMFSRFNFSPDNGTTVNDLAKNGSGGDDE